MAIRADLHELQCGTCGVWHAIPSAMYDSCVEEGGYWHCPNGHSRGYREGRHERDAIRRERDLLKQKVAQKDDEIKRQRELKEAAEREAAASRGQVTTLRNRAGAGVCPCCNRSFRQMALHMKNKHPNFRAEKVA